MTIHEKLSTELVAIGLWPNEAEAVLIQLKSDKASEAMERRWSDDVDGYTPQLLAGLLASAKVHAVEWIGRNAPRHFARFNLVG